MILALRGVDVRSYGIPTVEELLGRYSQLMDVRGIADKWPFYMAFTCFRSAAMMQGVHMRYSLGKPCIFGIWSCELTLCLSAETSLSPNRH